MIQNASRHLGFALLLLLAIALPFELDRPLLNVGPLAVTNLEIVLGGVLLTGGITWWQDGRLRFPARKRFGLLFTAGALFVITALLAPEQTDNALKAAFRLLSGMALALAVPQLVRRPQQRTWLLLAILVSGFMVATVGLAEVWLGREFSWLLLFRQGITVTGEYMRLTGPLDYANHAAMFIEVTVPLLLVAGVVGWQRSGNVSVILLAGLALLLLLQASFLTLSRAGFVTIGAVSVTMWLLLRRQTQASTMWLVMAGLVGLLFLLNTMGSEVFRLRFASEGDNSWYEASWQVPEQLTLAANEVQQIPITVTNRGALTWSSSRSQPIQLGARWIQVESGLQLAEPRWPFDQPIVPGETAEYQVALKAPSIPGEYTLVWDVVHEQVTWFGEKSGVFATSAVRVLPSNDAAPASEPTTASPAWSYTLPIPDRSTLWLLAAALFAERPLLGIGLDNFRLAYGRYLGASSWNETIHTNNWYLEFLVGGGLLAALPFFAWLIWESVLAWRVIRQPFITQWQTAVFAGLLAFLIHGLLDFFLLFNSTGLLFWLLVGIWWHFLEETPRDLPAEVKMRKAVP